MAGAFNQILQPSHVVLLFALLFWQVCRQNGFCEPHGGKQQAQARVEISGSTAAEPYSVSLFFDTLRFLLWLLVIGPCEAVFNLRSAFVPASGRSGESEEIEQRANEGPSILPLKDRQVDL